MLRRRFANALARVAVRLLGLADLIDPHAEQSDIEEADTDPSELRDTSEDLPMPQVVIGPDSAEMLCQPARIAEERRRRIEHESKPEAPLKGSLADRIGRR